MVNEKYQFNEYVKYAKEHLADVIPYNSPNYEEELQAMAEQYAEWEMNGYPIPSIETVNIENKQCNDELPF